MFCVRLIKLLTKKVKGGDKMPYNYSRLRGKIREVYGTETKFAEALGDTMARPTLSLKLNGKAEWSQVEMHSVMKLLKEPITKIGYYFFYK